MRWFLFGVAASVIALSLAIALAGQAATKPSAAGPRSNAALVIDDSRFTPNRIDARAGQPLTITVTNAGSHRHDLLFDSAHMPGLAGAEAIVDPGQSQSLTLVFDAPGVHMFRCSEAGHAGSGLVGAVWVSS